MIKRFAALLVLVSVLSVTIVHACSGLNGIPMASLHNPSENPMISGEPCIHSNQDNDTCKSVRYRMISIQPEPVQHQRVLLPSTLMDEVSLHDVIILAGLPNAPPWTANRDSLFTHSPRFSHIVLRI